VLEHLQTLSPGFAAGRRGKGLARRFRRVIHVVDSSTIALIASCIDWAQYRRRKTAAKLHVRLDLHSLLPRFVLVESARAADSIRAARKSAPESNRARLLSLIVPTLISSTWTCSMANGVFWVTRSKESLCFRVVKKLPKATDKRILSDELVVLKNKDSRANYPEAMRRVRALVEVDGKERAKEFLTNNVSWGATSVLICIAAAGKSKCSLNKSSRAYSCAISWATAPMPSAGRPRRRCCSMS
jgi:hypothetical protein